ncbi:hypothetical protein IT895_12505 [Halomonas sp. A40-4]|uniref:hypothetical protein n=1 Tax=Halomonas sp. A40-4 TaxID=2785909 RepID=UPI0018F02E50|nr:hypothetical protein [Halomonas sp. A40-4]QPL45014.1 hypothetical protein IT895_12505 [Halomonas sp. A40-4]
MATCEDCNREATHILVNYNHDTVQPEEVYCAEHAFDDGREMCSICENFGYAIEYTDENDEDYELQPTYAPGQLDAGHMCSDHP